LVNEADLSALLREDRQRRSKVAPGGVAGDRDATRIEAFGSAVLVARSSTLAFGFGAF
jgi:hypothetical protein